MDSFQRKSIMIVVGSIEQQLSSLRNLLMLGSDDEKPAHKVHKHTLSDAYTTEQEDKMIEDALKLDSTEMLMQDIFKQAGKDGE